MYVYIIQCSDNSYYTGVTNDLKSRYIDHETSNNIKSYTHSRRPFKLLYWEIHESPEEAILREKHIKKWNRAKKFALINGENDKLVILAKKKR